MESIRGWCVQVRCKYCNILYKGLENLKILVPQVSPGTNPWWILRDDCILFPSDQIKPNCFWSCLLGVRSSHHLVLILICLVSFASETFTRFTPLSPPSAPPLPPPSSLYCPFGGLIAFSLSDRALVSSPTLPDCKNSESLWLSSSGRTTW